MLQETANCFPGHHQPPALCTGNRVPLVWGGNYTLLWGTSLYLLYFSTLYLYHKDKRARPKFFHRKVNVKWSRYRSGVAQRVGRGIALLFHDCDTRRGWVVSSKPRPQFTPKKDPVPILQEAGWAPGPVWTDGKSRPHRYSIPDRPACKKLSYT